MDYRLLDDDVLTKTRTWFVPSSDGEQFTLVTEQDMAVTLELNQYARQERDRRAPWGDGQLLARIPNTVLIDLQRKGILDDEPAFKRWLNDPDNKVFRLREGKV